MLKTPSYSEYGINENKLEIRKAVNQPIIPSYYYALIQKVLSGIWEETWDLAAEH